MQVREWRHKEKRKFEYSSRIKRQEKGKESFSQRFFLGNPQQTRNGRRNAATQQKESEAPSPQTKQQKWIQKKKEQKGIT
ncbi:hypothetical protein K9O30_01735 [Clostridium bowmanii]|uniref:hypothetical protein n=1 Tax=Clostridium bowmanii TaxID=132925 RepID=UPI001C0BAEAB|nr:hypothetical protein [Clostridium bowmanii]MBU3190309.1 hypothetical protein [Clostridium bowmanii]MCA1072479.1 hypothetical protein [Clostridium bowmanii]